MDDKTIRKIEGRLNRLEEVVFGREAKRRPKPTASKFSGAAGGIRLIVSKNFFAHKRTLADVRAALAKNGYHYSSQAVDMAVRRLATRKGPLMVLKEDASNLYVNRK